MSVIVFSFYFFAVHHHVLQRQVLNGPLGEGLLLGAVLHVDVLKREVRQPELVGTLHVEKHAAVHPDVLERHVVALRQGHVGAVLLLVELRPAPDEQAVAALAGEVLYPHVFIVLRRVGAHLQPEHVVGVVGHAVAHDHVPVVHRLRAQRHAAMHRAIMAVLHQYIITGTILRSLVGKGALAALQHHGIVVHVHIAAAHHHVVAHVDVDGIGRRALDARGRRVDVEVEVAHVVAAVDVVGPEGRVDQPHVLDGHVLRVADIGQAGPLGILVGALAVPLTANPELLPVGLAAAVDGAPAGDSEAVEAVGIDQRHEVLAGLALDAGLADLEVVHALRPLQHAALLNVEMGALLEEEAARIEGTLGHHDDAAALLGCTVDDGLDGLRLDVGRTLAHAVVGQHILLAQGLHVDLRRVGEPLGHRLAVGPHFLLSHLFLSHGHGAQHQHHQAHQQSLFHCYSCFMISF